MSDDPFDSFDEFWGHYLTEHRKPMTRALHALGAGGAVGSVITALIKKDPKYLALVPILGYGPAWLGHVLVEGNTPTEFDHPLWSLKGDAKMLTKMLTGELEAEYNQVLDHEDDPEGLLKVLESLEAREH